MAERGRSITGRPALLPGLCACIAFLCVGCATTGPVSFRVSSDGDPVRGAQVRAIPLMLHPVPLPVSFETLRESSIEQGASGVTSADGTLTLRLSAGRPYRIEVLPPPLRDEATDDPLSVWRFSVRDGLSRLGADHRDGPGGYKIERARR